MPYFDFRHSIIHYSVNLYNSFVIKLFKVFRIFSLIAFLFFLILFLVNYLLFSNYQESILGFTLFAFSFLIFFFVFVSFFNSKIKNPKIPKNSDNLADYFTFEVGLAMKKCSRYIRKFKIPFISTTLFFYSLIENSSNFQFILNRGGINRRELREKIEKNIRNVSTFEKESERFKNMVEAAKKISEVKKHKRIEIGDIVASLARIDPYFQNALIEYDLKIEDIYGLIDWQERILKHERENSKFWEYRNLIKKGSLARDWAAGYTINLDKYSINWSGIVKNQGYPEGAGYSRELEQVERILSNPEINNVMIVGEPGVGVKNILFDLARKSVLEQSLPDVNNKRVVELKVPSLLAELNNLDEVEIALENIFREVISAGNIILIIDEFDNLVEKGQRPGTIDISGIISQYLSFPQFRFIALTSYAGLHKKIELNPSLLNYFVKVEVAEPSKEEALVMIERLVPSLERKYRRYFSYSALKEIINLSDRYISTVPFPKKAKDLLESAVVQAVGSDKRWITPGDISELISKRTEIPVGKIEKKEKNILLNLEKLIHQRIINQDEAVREVSSALRRARSEIIVRKQPMGDFLFLGPTGVGKTETSKALASIYFNSEERMIRLDMSEFQNLDDIDRLIGSPGYEGLLTTEVRENPFSLILLDEIEKAHPNVLNLFLQVLDEGHITDGLGRRIDFKNTIIIATSNAGYRIILKALKEGKNMDEIKEELLEYFFQEGIFRPEFINRFDAVVVFKSLTRQNLLDISHLMLSKIVKSLEDKNIQFVITPELKEKMVELGYDVTFGARNMKRIIQNKVENPLAEALLREDVQKGQRITVNPDNFSVEVV